MYAGRILGRVVATRKYPTLAGMRFLIVQPTTAAGDAQGDPVIAVDTIGTGAGEWVYLVDSRDAGFAFGEGLIPVDAAIVGIIDASDLIDIEVT